MPGPTLKMAREAAAKKATVRASRPSDFLTKDQQFELALAREKGKRQHIHFSEVDAYVAEIIARFGYNAYKDWNAGLIKNETMARWIVAERTREKAKTAQMLNVIVSAVAGANNPTKNGQAPKSLKAATKNLKKISNEIKEASR